MAVLLCRSDGKPLLQPVPLEMRGMPRIKLDYEPVPGHLSYLGKSVLTRTESQFACVEQPREVTGKSRRDRHHTQLTQCGFHVPTSQPYKDLGPVELDDRKLILETLGQIAEDGPEVEEVDNATGQMPTKEIKLRPSSLISPYKVKLHSKTLYQSSELLSMEDKIKHGGIQLGYLRKGRSLLGLMEKEKQEKKLQESRKRRQGQSALKRQWREAEVATDLVGNDLARNGNGLLATDLAGNRNGLLATDLAGNRNGLLLRPDTDQAKRKSSLAPCQMGVGGISNESDLSGHDEQDESMEEGSVVRQWYRKLSVMIWVLEAMKLESLHYCIPLSHCWDLNCVYVDNESGKRAYEWSRRKKQIWQDRIFSPTQHKSFKAKVASLIAFGNFTPKIAAKVSNETDLSSHRSLGISQAEEDELKRQDRFKKRIHAKWGSRTPPVTLDLQAMQTKFSDADQERKMIVHEQLLVMERDRVEALQQRLGSLHVSVNMWRDLAAMREGLQIGTTAMARRKLLMNYRWFEDLVAVLPEEVLSDTYCQQRLYSLHELADYMCSVGPGKVSKKKLIQVLATLTSWELQDPDIGATIMYLIREVVYVSEMDYQEWLKQHIAVHSGSRPRREPRLPHQRSPSRIGDTPSHTGEPISVETSKTLHY